MKITVSHPTGNRNVRAVLTALLQADNLVEFDTTIAANPRSIWINSFPKGIKREWLRRTYPIPADIIWTHPFLELSRLILPRLGLKSFVKKEKSWASIDAVYKNFDKAVSKRIKKTASANKTDAVYAYEDAAFSTFTAAKKIGLRCIYDLPIAYWETGRRLLLEEAKRMPAWSETLGGGIYDSNEKLERKTKELELADIVVGPGDFVLNSLPEWAKEKKLIMVPFGTPEVREAERIEQYKVQKERPLRVLFAGSMGQRKGLGDVFLAIKMLKRQDIELVVMGSLLAPFSFYKKELSNFTYEPPRPHADVLALMKTCDVFCLPSIVEGRALVMQEAMSQGLPVIITPNTGGADLIREGVTGFLIPIRSPEAIAEKLTWFLENRSKIPEMGRMAKEHASTYTWEKYGSTIIESIDAYNIE